MGGGRGLSRKYGLDLNITRLTWVSHMTDRVGKVRLTRQVPDSIISGSEKGFLKVMSAFDVVPVPHQCNNKADLSCFTALGSD